MSWYIACDVHCNYRESRDTSLRKEPITKDPSKQDQQETDFTRN